MTVFAKILSEGGCYWRKDKNSPGHSFVIANGTPFKIATEGPTSSRYIDGMCQDGFFITQSKKFSSANGAVNAVREPSSNAFLYIRFLIGGKWIVADDLRFMDILCCDRVGDEAIDIALKNEEHKNKKQKKTVTDVELLKAAAAFIVRKPEILEIVKMQLDQIDSLTQEYFDAQRP